MEQTNRCERQEMSEIKKIKKGAGVSVQSVIVRTAGFLLARAMPAAGIAPFGLSFVALERRHGGGVAGTAFRPCAVLHRRYGACLYWAGKSWK